MNEDDLSEDEIKRIMQSMDEFEEFMEETYGQDFFEGPEEEVMEKIKIQEWILDIESWEP